MGGQKVVSTMHGCTWVQHSIPFLPSFHPLLYLFFSHRFEQILTDSNRFLQIRTDSYRFEQILTDSNRFLQILTEEILTEEILTEKQSMGERKEIRLLLVLSSTILFHLNHMCVGGGVLKDGFYALTCPTAESLVSSSVAAAVSSDPTIPAALLRLHFHDCFVQGCDGSILVNNGAKSEKFAFGHQGVRGFEIIDSIKARLENICPNVVSCADIVALAARDAITLSKGPFYKVPTGRRDGRVSDLLFAVDMPDVNDPIQLLKLKFKRKGLSDRDLVLLSSAHTIGTTACFFMMNRLYNSTGLGMKNVLWENMKARCPKGGDINVRIPLDPVSSLVFDDRLIHNIRDGLAVIGSDASLDQDEETRRVVDAYLNSQDKLLFISDFVASIIRMGSIEVKTGLEGDIRRVCSSFNN